MIDKHNSRNRMKIYEVECSSSLVSEINNNCVLIFSFSKSFISSKYIFLLE